MKEDFPIFQKTINGHPLTYLDNAASTQKPRQVLDAMTAYYTEHNANVSRGVHTLADESTTAFENARITIARFFDAPTEQAIFTSGTTDAMNFVAHSIQSDLSVGDEIILSIMEHHTNLLPWQRIAQNTGAKLVFVGFTDDFQFDMEDFENKLSEKTKFVCITQASNVFGTVTPIKKITELAHEKNACVVVDGAQAAGHLPVNFSALKVDFYACSAHKMYGPQGIGVLLVSKEQLGKLHPYRLGGGAVATVTTTEHTLLDPPHCFEAGTPNVAGAVGFAAAIEYIEQQGFENIQKHDKELTSYAWELLQGIPEVQLFGPSPTVLSERAAIVSFTVEDVHAHDVAQILDSYGVAIRSGTHCAEPLHDNMDVQALNRASFACYNTKEDVEKLVLGIQEAIRIFAGDSHE